MQESGTLPELQKLLGQKHLRSTVSRLDDVLKPGKSAGSGTRRAQEVETLIASK